MRTYGTDLLECKVAIVNDIVNSRSSNVAKTLVENRIAHSKMKLAFMLFAKCTVNRDFCFHVLYSMKECYVVSVVRLRNILIFVLFKSIFCSRANFGAVNRSQLYSPVVNNFVT